MHSWSGMLRSLMLRSCLSSYCRPRSDASVVGGTPRVIPFSGHQVEALTKVVVLAAEYHNLRFFGNSGDGDSFAVGSMTVL